MLPFKHPPPQIYHALANYLRHVIQDVADVYSRAKPKDSICLLYKWAYTAFWLCRAVYLSRMAGSLVSLSSIARPRPKSIVHFWAEYLHITFRFLLDSTPEKSRSWPSIVLMLDQRNGCRCVYWNMGFTYLEYLSFYHTTNNFQEVFSREFLKVLTTSFICQKSQMSRPITFCVTSKSLFAHDPFWRFS